MVNLQINYYSIITFQKSKSQERVREVVKHLGRLAQLVQSICLTSRGSAVRIRQRPHFF